ncbi:cytochrome b/b6 domain-containing protein [[Phormidium] sp. ETS-05]|uniref:cytochrome b/b6 domain-containing protein n=1 Tax=[Phormidium] sp. ETS-05 TaxID=222819 RepID=UPI001E5C8A4D|nr:cytochrome b/b6 domain-containing protein [[Phormidium] sp. ETS-05]
MKIKPLQPYQPLLLRLLHSVNAFLVIGALITGFLVYDSWDGRFGGLGLSIKNRELIDIHGTFGFFCYSRLSPLPSTVSASGENAWLPLIPLKNCNRWVNLFGGGRCTS